MATLRKLARFEVDGAGIDFTLHDEDDAGIELELTATIDQLDVPSPTVLDDILLLVDSADEVEVKE